MNFKDIEIYSCHEEDVYTHNQYCIDKSDCRYGMADGPDDYLKECECIIDISKE